MLLVVGCACPFCATPDAAPPALALRSDWCKRLEVQDTAKLVMPPTRGDWMRMIDHMNWKLTNDDVMGAGKLL